VFELNTGTMYHICPKRKWFASFEKVDVGLLSFGDGHTCHIEGICIVRIKMFHETIRGLQNVRYVPQLKKDLISVGTLEAHGLRRNLREVIFKMFSGLLVVLKNIRCNNLYYLKDNIVIENLAPQNI